MRTEKLSHMICMCACEREKEKYLTEVWRNTHKNTTHIDRAKTNTSEVISCLILMIKTNKGAKFGLIWGPRKLTFISMEPLAPPLSLFFQREISEIVNRLESEHQRHHSSLLSCPPTGIFFMLLSHPVCCSSMKEYRMIKSVCVCVYELKAFYASVLSDPNLSMCVAPLHGYFFLCLSILYLPFSSWPGVRCLFRFVYLS